MSEPDRACGLYDHQYIGQTGPTHLAARRQTQQRHLERSNGTSNALSGGELYTAHSSADGEHWIRGSTWHHSLGPGARIGIFAENTAGFTINIDYVRVYTLK